MSRESWYQIHIPARVGKPLQKDAKCLCSVHVHAIVANNSVWKIQNFAQFVYIVFVKPELRLSSGPDRIVHSSNMEYQDFFRELTSYKSKHSVASIILQAKDRRIVSLTFDMI